MCGRTFAAEPLQKHRKVCAKTAAKKRHVFDSSKQRVEGTDIAPFYQKQVVKKPQNQHETTNSPPTEPNKNKWKEKRPEPTHEKIVTKGKPKIKAYNCWLFVVTAACIFITKCL